MFPLSLQGMDAMHSMQEGSKAALDHEFFIKSFDSQLNFA